MVVFKRGPVFRILLGFFFLASAAVPGTLCAAAKSKPAAGSYFVYVASSTSPAAKNSIYGYRFNSGTGQLTAIGKMAEVESVSWIATDPRHRYLYAAAEDSKNGHGTISSFSIDSITGSLKFLNIVDGGGAGSCHLATDSSGKTLFVANYGSGTVA
jgi:6-phosphogluconolactonase